MANVWYTEEEKKLAVQYYLASGKSLLKCGDDLNLNEYDLPNWLYRIDEEDKYVPNGISAEILKETFFESIRQREAKTKKKAERKKRFYRPTSASMVYRR